MAVKFKVGDKVWIRSWNSMAQEYGVDNDGDIKNGFIEEMKHLCLTIATIKDIPYTGCIQIINLEFLNENKIIIDWVFTSEMIEKVEE